MNLPGGCCGSEYRQGVSLSGGIAHIRRQQWEEAVAELKEDKRMLDRMG